MSSKTITRLLGLAGLIAGLASQPVLAQGFRFRLNQGGNQPRSFARPGMNNSNSNFNEGGFNDVQGPQRSYGARPGMNNNNMNEGGFNDFEDGSGSQPPRAFKSTRPGGWNEGSNWSTEDYSSRPGYNNYPSNNWSNNNYDEGPGAEYVPPYNASHSPIVIDGCDQTALSFTLVCGDDRWDRSVSAGGTYECSDDREWYIKYHRGGEWGYTTYRLKPGHYYFAPSDRGWQCYKRR